MEGELQTEQAAVSQQTTESAAFAGEVRAFLDEFGLTMNALDRGVYPSFTHRLLVKNVNPHKSSIQAARLWMHMVREDEPERMREAAATICAAGGFITMTPGGEIEKAPDGIPHARLRRMMTAGLLVPSGDAMFGVTSQTYRLSDLAFAF